MDLGVLMSHTSKFLGEGGGEDLTVLREIISIHDYKYRIENAPVISDQDYDALYQLLVDLESMIPIDQIPSDSPTQRVGYEPLEGFEKIAHRIPMLSLQNTYSSDDILSWSDGLQRILDKVSNDHKHDDIRYLIQPKLDGSSVEIVYEYGQLTQASTRGNGSIGEDITLHVKNITGVPHMIDERKDHERIHLRGEIVLGHQAFTRINKKQIAEGKQPFANPRNAAAGTLRQLDPSLAHTRGLQCFVFSVLWGSGSLGYQTDSEQMQSLKKVGLPVHPRSRTGCTLQEVIDYCNDPIIQKTTQEDLIACDGLVVKIENLHLRIKIGLTQHHPKRAIAYKYPSLEVVAHLQDIQWQVGRTGVLTPVAIIDPVAVGGVVVQRATLHNLAFIIQRGLSGGVDVWIKRSGEVIPYVIGLVDASRQTDYLPPTVCPSCESEVIVSDDLSRIQCVNTSCPAQQVEKLKHYISRDAANIDGLGGSTIQLLYDQGVVTTIDDLYTLNTLPKKQTITALPGLGEKKYQRIVTSVESSKNLPIYTIIYALGIPGVGKKLAKTLVQGLVERKNSTESSSIVFDMHEYIMSDQVVSLYGIGDEIILSLRKRIQNPQSQQLLKRLESYGVLHTHDGNQPTGGFFDGKSVCITGSFERPRRELVQIIENQGGSIVSTISKNTDILLVGESAGSKLQKAIALSIPRLSEQKLQAYI